MHNNGLWDSTFITSILLTMPHENAGVPSHQMRSMTFKMRLFDFGPRWGSSRRSPVLLVRWEPDTSPSPTPSMAAVSPAYAKNPALERKKTLTSGVAIGSTVSFRQKRFTMAAAILYGKRGGG